MMKKFNLFAIGVVAMFVAAVGVNAQVSITQDTTNGVIATGTVEDSTDLDKCLEAKEATCTIAENVSFDKIANVTGNVKLTLNDGVVVNVPSSYYVVVNPDAKLSITGGEIKSAAKSIFQVKVGATLDVNGTKLTAATTKASAYAFRPVIAVYGGATDADKTTTVNVNGTVTGYAGLVVYPDGKNDSNRGNHAEVHNVNVTVDGTWNTTSYGVQVQGDAQGMNASEVNVTVNGGTFTSKGTTLYAAGNATWVIKGGKFTGFAPMNIKSGNVTVEDGEFLATLANANAASEDNANSSTAALLVANGAGYNGNVSLVIEKGTFKNTNGAALVIASGASVANHKVSVNGGYFEGTTAAVTNAVSALKNYITGGTFVTTTSGTAIPANSLANSYKGLEKGLNGGKIVTVGKTSAVKKVTIAKITNTTGDVLSLPVISGDGSVSPIELFAGNKLDLNEYLGFDPDEYTFTYKITAGDATITKGVLTMGSQDSTIEIVIEPWRKPTAEDEKTVVGPDVTPTEEQNPADTTPEQKPDDTKNPDTLDNITSVAAMGGISLAIAAAGIATLKKREN